MQCSGERDEDFKSAFRTFYVHQEREVYLHSPFCYSHCAVAFVFGTFVTRQSGTNKEPTNRILFSFSFFLNVHFTHDRNVLSFNPLLNYHLLIFIFIFHLLSFKLFISFNTFFIFIN